MALVQRAMAFTFTMGPDAKGNPQTFPGGSNSITIPVGNQASMRMLNAGAPGSAQCTAMIWGLTPDVMNAVNTLGTVVSLNPGNLFSVAAGTADGVVSTVFVGAIWEAVPDMNQQPDPPLIVRAQASLDIAVNPVPPVSYTGTSDISVILTDLCTRAHYYFESNGVTGFSLSNSYLYGSPREQITKVARALEHRGVSWAFIENGRTFAIWPTKGARLGDTIPEVSAGDQNAPGTLIGYPSYNVGGVNFRCVWNPNLRIGGQVSLKTSLFKADGLYTIQGLGANLDSQIPGGKWESTVDATRFGYQTPVVAQGIR